MTKKVAVQVRGMTTGETVNFEKKGLDRIVLKNHRFRWFKYRRMGLDRDCHGAFLGRTLLCCRL